MTFRNTLLAFCIYLSSSYVSTFRFHNYGQHRPPNPHPPFNYPPQDNCYQYYNPAECTNPAKFLIKMLIDAHAREIERQNERFLHRLYEISRDHNRKAHLERLAAPPLPAVDYPMFTTNDGPFDWSVQPRMSNIRNQFKNTLLHRPAATVSSTNRNGVLTNIFKNRGINSNIHLTAIRHEPTTVKPTTFPSIGFRAVEEITEPTTIVKSENDFTLHKIPPPINLADTVIYKRANQSSDSTAPSNTNRHSKLVETKLLPLNVTPLIYNVEIGVNATSDEKSIRKYLTINAFTEEPKQPNHLNGLVQDSRKLTLFANNGTRPRINSTLTTNSSIIPSKSQETEAQRKQKLFESYLIALDKLERKFYAITFKKLTVISPEGRQENGISFVQSALFLSLHLMALSTETDEDTKAEIDKCLGLNITDADKLNITTELLSTLPKSSFDLKWRWSSRLVLGPNQTVSEEFRSGAASALNLQMGQFYGNETNDALADSLNRMVEEDSGGAIRNTFEPDELSGGVRAVALTTLYMRARWRSAPTVLNGTRPFRDADGAPPRTVRMIRINDYMQYANFADWNFQAIEIFYATRGLSLLVLVPHDRSLRSLASLLETVSVTDITKRMITMRVAVTMPLYTLRMTLLLPSKLKALGVNKLTFDSANNTTDSGRLKLSHAVQRLMFWAEAGRNAFKDDGIEWDPEPELELVVDRPYLFFVRWHNVTIMNGNFVL